MIEINIVYYLTEICTLFNTHFSQYALFFRKIIILNVLKAIKSSWVIGCISMYRFLYPFVPDVLDHVRRLHDNI